MITELKSKILPSTAIVAALSFGCTKPSDVIPARVVSGSMAPHYVGEHWRLTCGDCGHVFDCGVEHPPDGMMAVCPNCGYAENKVDEHARQPGTAVNVVPRDLAADPPRRWEVMAFREPGAEHVAVKRVVGLPGERVAIRGGDIFVDGRRVQKSPEEFAEIGQMVFNELNFPRLTNDFPPRWRPKADDSRWKPLKPEEPNYWWRCTPGEQAEAIDWLKYRHLSGAAVAAERTAESRILDNYAYNQGLARGLNAVRDVMFYSGLKLSGEGDFGIQLLGGMRPLVVWLSAGKAPDNEDAIALWHGDDQITAADANVRLGDGAALSLGVGIIDGRVVVELDDERALMFDLDTIGVTKLDGDLAIALGNRGLEVDLIMPGIFRDVYYLNPQHRPNDWEMEKPLGEDEYFLLGDNPPNSRDSRHYGPVQVASLLGGVENRGE